MKIIASKTGKPFWYENVDGMHDFNFYRVLVAITRGRGGGAGGTGPPKARNLTCVGGLVSPDQDLIACRYRQMVPPPQKKLLTPTYGRKFCKMLTLVLYNRKYLAFVNFLATWYCLITVALKLE